MAINFSIGIPAYKSDFLRECISSICNQTYNEFELIIINDCSPEPIKEVVETFNDCRIKYFENSKNTGAENVVDNWNMCLERATGDFFILMGDDDKLEPDYLEEFCRLINKYPELDIYHCRSLIINESSKPITLTQSWPEYESVYDNIWHRIELLRHQFISDFVYRTSNLKKNGGFYKLPLAWASDDITAYIACSSKGIAHTNKPIFNYRVNNKNISSTGCVELKMKATCYEEHWLKAFLKEEPLNSSDKVIYSALRSNSLKNYFRIKKRKIIREAVRRNLIVGTLRWWKKRREYSITSKDIIAGIIASY